MHIFQKQPLAKNKHFPKVQGMTREKVEKKDLYREER